MPEESQLALDAEGSTDGIVVAVSIVDNSTVVVGKKHIGLTVKTDLTVVESVIAIVIVVVVVGVVLS